MTESQEYDELVGVVAVQVTGTGSKSEMEQVVLFPEGEPGAVVLRRRDAVALDAEPELAAYDGLRVRVRGQQYFSTFVVDEVQVDDSSAG